MLVLELGLMKVLVWRHVLATTHLFAFVVIIEVIGVLLMTTALIPFTVDSVVIAILLVVLGFIEPTVVRLLLDTSIGVTILGEVTLLVLLLVMLGQLIWVPIIIRLLLTVVTSWSSDLLMLDRRRLPRVDLARHLIVVLMLLQRLMG